jgi:hypothetical protein
MRKLFEVNLVNGYVKKRRMVPSNSTGVPG